MALAAVMAEARGRHGPFRPRGFEGLEDLGGSAGSSTGTQVGGQEDLLGDAGAELLGAELLAARPMKDIHIYIYNINIYI